MDTHTAHALFEQGWEPDMITAIALVNISVTLDRIADVLEEQKPDHC